MRPIPAQSQPVALDSITLHASPRAPPSA
jgi:hypothetical protein